MIIYVEILTQPLPQPLNIQVPLHQLMEPIQQVIVLHQLMDPTQHLQVIVLVLHQQLVLHIQLTSQVTKTLFFYSFNLIYRS